MKTKIVLALIGVSLALSSAAPRKLLIEESTDVDCGPCPGAALYLDSLHHEFKGQVIPVAFHYDDAMSGPASYGYMAHWRKGYPNFSLERTSALGLADFQSDSSKRYAAISDSIKSHLAVESPVSVSIEKTWDESTRKIVGKVKVAFEQDLTASDLRIGLLLIQDTVIGPNEGQVVTNHAEGIGARYMQKNYYSDSMWNNATWIKGVLQAGSSKLNNGMLRPEAFLNPLKSIPWPIMGYAHRHVFRASLLGPADSAWGVKGVIPANPKTGAKYESSFSYTLPAQFDGYDGMATKTFSASTGVIAKPSQMKLVAFVSSAGRTKILNAEEVDLVGGQTTSVQHQRNLSWSGGQFTMERAGLVQVFDLRGQTVAEKQLDAMQSFDFSGLASGRYNLRFTSGSSVQNFDLIKE